MELCSRALGFQTTWFAYLHLVLFIPLGGIGFGQDTKNVEQKRDDQETVVDSAVDLEKDAKDKDKVDAHTPEGQLAIKRFYLKQVFQVEIELIQRLCNPTPEQVMKLRIASKGAAKKLTEEWGKKKGLIVAEKGEAQEGDESEQPPHGSDLEVVEVNDTDDIDLTDIEEIVLSNDGNPFKTKRPQEHEVWKSLLSGILSPDQVRMLSEYAESQEVKRREDLLTLFIGTVAREIALSAEQQSKLREILHPHFVKTNWPTLPAFYGPFLSYYIASNATKDELTAVLTPAQLQLYQMYITPFAEEIREEIENMEEEEFVEEKEEEDSSKSEDKEEEDKQ